MTVNTKKVTDRRELRYDSLADLRADVERFRDAGDSIQALGNWSPGQAMQHLARFTTCSLDGFGKSPKSLRLMGMLVKLFAGKKLFNNPPPPGYQLPKTAIFRPDDNVETATGASELLAVIDRIEKGDQFIPNSPLLGPLTREKWITLHLRHAELHLSFFKA